MKIFITGIGTEVGKTVCSAILTACYQAAYWKPVQSGDLQYTDSMKIGDWAGEDITIYPETYRLQLAASPHQSAAAEGLTIRLDDFRLPETSHPLIIEGAGGLMVPLSDNALMIDLIEKLALPVALVVRNYLGCINHTLLSLMALQQRGLYLKYLILNGSFPSDTERIILKHTDKSTAIIRIPETKNPDRASITNIAKKISIENHE
ncbi:dethiobiotin synthase [Chryseobacterium camelliae]|uniref:dethiobiotin synthase n=1 Tax=Chryseobacterium camelliae TaxID=1265445 RepID=UPI0028560A1A|nr:dethiobiotin synthase [Chryseobacterium camelliae]MDR6515486.1 dethiobiotin synthetase [Chryseobacterium camelliae]